MSENTVPLLKFLCESGVGSRRKMADAIKQGLVQVNRVTAEDFRQPLDPSKDVVTLDGQRVNSAKPQSIYLMMNKPPGIITTASDEMDRQTVLELLPAKYRSLRLYPVGRLDKDSSGLLLLTNDGDLTYQLTHPKFEHEKEYWIALNGTLEPPEIQKLEQGIELDDGMTYPARIRQIQNSSLFNYSITIHEGRKRQVRRMFESLGYRVQTLKRMRIGALWLGDLKEGQVRELSKAEIRALRKPPLHGKKKG
ncbi:MAG: pseudouridine synthase [Dehalococcoidia bacterium]|nr:pseudouridine synthase [Dehalococcoidia bacterium]